MTTSRRLSSKLLLLLVGLAVLATLALIPWIVQAQSQEVTPTAAPTGENPPAVPMNLQSSATHDSVTLTWTASTDQTVTHYAILRRNPATDASQVFHVIESNAGAETSYTDLAVSASTTYIYRVKSVSPTGVSRWSGFAKADTPAAPPPTATPTATPTPDDGEPSNSEPDSEPSSRQEVTCQPTSTAKCYAENGTSKVASYTVTDPEGGGLIWFLTGIDNDDFSLVGTPEGNKVKLVVNFAEPPDYEDPKDADGNNVYQVTVNISDGANAASASITVTVTNEEEPGTVEFSSVQPEQGTPYTATLTDPDGSVTITGWTWESSQDKSTWSTISEATTNAYTPVAGDLGKYLRVTVSYSDGEGAGKSAQTTSDHTVHEPHENNHAPEFPASETGARTVAENTPSQTSFGDPVEATDEHHASVLTYTLRGTDAASFAIVRTSGQLLTRSSLDYETRSSYSVTVRASDPSNEHDEVVVTITITNVDEPGTVALSSAHPVVGTEITATLSDPDGSVSGVTWSWERSPDGSTGWTPISGVTSDSYTPSSGDEGYLRATASYTDAEGSGKNAQAVTVEAVVGPIDHAPNFHHTETGVRSIAENEPPGTDVGAPFEAVDADGHTLTFFLLDTPDARFFEIDAASGQLRTREPLNYEVRSVYQIFVAVHDSGEDHPQDDHSADADLAAAIVVTDVDDSLSDGRCVLRALGIPALLPSESPTEPEHCYRVTTYNERPVSYSYSQMEQAIEEEQFSRNFYIREICAYDANDPDNPYRCGHPHPWMPYVGPYDVDYFLARPSGTSGTNFEYWADQLLQSTGDTVFWYFYSENRTKGHWTYGSFEEIHLNSMVDSINSQLRRGHMAFEMQVCSKDLGCGPIRPWIPPDGELTAESLAAALPR